MLIRGFSSVRVTHSVLSAVLSSLIILPGCGGDNSGSSSTSHTSAVCSEAFKPAGVKGAANPSGVGLSTCSLDAGRNVVVGTGGCGPDVFVDQNFTGAMALGTITVDSGGILYFPDNHPGVQVDTSGILVNNGGILRVGTIKCPTGNEGIGDRVVINFTGAPPQPTIPKGITVMSGGTLTMYGEKGTPLNQYGPDLSWSYLAAPAGPAIDGAKARVPMGGANTIQVAGQLDWQANDWIVVASTDFDPDAGEFVQIASQPSYNSTTKITTISLKQNLVNYHFGGPAPDDTLSDPNCKNGDGVVVRASYCEGAAQNFGVDERAEVGLVTRSIKLTSTQTELPFWQANTAYAMGAIIQGQAIGTTGSPPVVTTYQFKATTGGTSGPNPPNFPNSNGTNAPPDGTVVWTNMGAIDLHWGGEINIAGGATTQIEGVELENFGKDNRFSSPITISGPTNLPATNTPDGDLAYNSIHHSYNHGIVLYSATVGSPPNGLKINGNVIARATGHLYDLADGTATDIAFTNNLGVGAMEYAFGTCNIANNQIAPCVGLTGAQFAVRQMFWLGDNLAAVNHYDGYNIPLTDPPPPAALAPVSGFFITNITASLTGNSIAGCQGNGNGVLYLPGTAVQTGPVATFLNNRLHGCYVGLDASYGLSPGYSGNLNNIQPKDAQNLDQLTTFDGLTATRNRYFGTWMRPNYFVVNNARFATNRESVSLVSGGGPESSPAGEWGLLENSVAVGESQNNPNRFGPCPITPTQAPAGPWGNDGLHGCNGDDFAGRGYPQPYWNEYGYMFYDGPARLDSNRFVNFVQDIAGIGTTAAAIKTACAAANPGPGLLTNDDATFLCKYSASATIPGNNASNSTGKPSAADSGFVYEGDAAFGWFQSNVNNYPPTQYSENMVFENVDLRHQVYTQEVNQGPFVDGDKGTVIVDRDGTLSGYGVVDPAGTRIAGKFAISLNNLPFLGTPNSVDECLASGPQDEVFEGRATSLISPQDYATLEINALTDPIGSVNCPATSPGMPINNNCPCVSWAGAPPTQIGNYNAANCNQFYFTKDQKDYVGVQQYDIDNLGPATLTNPFNPAGMELVACALDHSCISLAGRNQTGSYEPKVINGLGYTMQSIKGFPTFMDLGLVDAAAAHGISQRAVADASIMNGQAILTSVSAKFTSSDIGSEVVVVGAGSGPNGDLAATIISTSGNTATLSTGAIHTVSSAPATITHPFGVRLGICYKTQSGTTPTSASDFTVKLGRKSWSNTGGNLPLMAPFLYMQIPGCQGIDFSSPGNLLGCPAPPDGGSVQTLTGIDVSGVSPLPATLDPNAFYYDATSGLLFLSVQQTEENAIGSSPLGTPGCSGSTEAPCPDPGEGESFYSCPADGCGLYTISATKNYLPNGPTICTPYGAATDYSLSYPSNLNQLSYVAGPHADQSVQSFITPMNGKSFDTIFTNPATQQFPHNLDSNSNGDCTFK